MIKQQYDKFGKIMITEANVPALARTVSSSISASTEITFNASTTLIRVYASTKDVYLKWGIDNVEASNFDEIIPAGEVIDFAIPLQADGTPYTAINVIQREATATVVVIEK